MNHIKKKQQRKGSERYSKSEPLGEDVSVGKGVDAGHLSSDPHTPGEKPGMVTGMLVPGSRCGPHSKSLTLVSLTV